jgi:hypothetical protein
MGKSFWILIWNGWGCGLNMIQPRLFEIYDQKSCITFNSFSYQTEKDIDEFVKKNELEERYGNFYKIII